VERKHSWEQENSRGAKIMLWIIGFVVTLLILGFLTNWFGMYEKEEGTPPEVLFLKAEWCQSVSFDLDQRGARIDSLVTERVKIEKANEKKPESRWSRKAKENYRTLNSQIKGAKESYNSIAIRYNVAMEELGQLLMKGDSLPPGIAMPMKRFYTIFEDTTRSH